MIKTQKLATLLLITLARYFMILFKNDRSKLILALSVMPALASVPTLASAAPHIEEDAMIRAPVTESMAIVVGSVVNELGWPCDSISFASKNTSYSFFALQCDGGKYTYELDQAPTGLRGDLRKYFESE